MDELVLRFQPVGDVAVVSYGATEAGTALATEGGLYSLVDQHGYRKMVLDFRGVTYLMSSRLGQIITLKHKLNKVQGQLRMCGMDTSLREVFEITRLDTLIPIDNDVDGALKLM